MSEDEIKSICSVLAAIYHLGVAGAVKGKIDSAITLGKQQFLCNIKLTVFE